MSDPNMIYKTQIMQKDHPELADTHSPRNIVGLTHELESADAPQNGLMEFAGDENPFSFYHEDNHREDESQEEETEHNERPADAHNSSTTEEKIGVKELTIETGQNGANKPPLKQFKSPKAKIKSPKAVFTSPSALNSLRDPEVDLAKFSFTPPTLKANKKESESDAQYRAELQKEMSELKASSKGEKKKSKIFGSGGGGSRGVNKTHGPVGQGRKEEAGDMEAEQMRMLVKIGFQKKKANYKMLKQWDHRRAESMALHGKIIDQLQNQTDVRIKSSLQNFQLYQTFFREKAKQEQKYVGFPVVNTRFALQNNSLSKNVYINCSVILNALYDDNLSRCTRINHFIELIRHNILRELTEQHLDSSQKELLRIREKISTLKSTLKNYNHETEDKANELATLFTEQAANISYKVERDFYRTQLSFLRTACRQMQVQKKLGEYCLEYYHTAIQQQIKRSKVIHQAMVTYSQGLKQAYHIEIPPSQLEQMSKHEQIKLISELYSLDEMFDQRTMDVFRVRHDLKGDMTIEDLTQYISGFGYEPFDSRVILLKEFNVDLVGAGKDKEGAKKLCYLVITVDNFLHIFFVHPSSQLSKPDLTIKIHSKSLEVRPGKDELLDIIKKEERRNSMMAYFWDSRPEKIYRIKFKKRDNREEFMDYITKLMAEFN